MHKRNAQNIHPHIKQQDKKTKKKKCKQDKELTRHGREQFISNNCFYSMFSPQVEGDK